MPVAPSARNRNIAVGFDRITARAMAKHPDDRYPSAQEMAEDLRNFQNLEAPADVQCIAAHAGASFALARSGKGADQPGSSGQAGRKVFVARGERGLAQSAIMIFIWGAAQRCWSVAAGWVLAPKYLPMQEQPVVRVAALAPCRPQQRIQATRPCARQREKHHLLRYPSSR